MHWQISVFLLNFREMSRAVHGFDQQLCSVCASVLECEDEDYLDNHLLVLQVDFYGVHSLGGH